MGNPRKPIQVISAIESNINFKQPFTAKIQI